jgi:hypothetical protein
MHACKANTKTIQPNWNKERRAVCVMQIFLCRELFHRLNEWRVEAKIWVIKSMFEIF